MLDKIMIGVVLMLFGIMIYLFVDFQSQMVKKEVINTYTIIDKIDEIDSQYNFFLQSYKTVTNYYLILENYGSYKVYIDEYSKYKIGDEYSIITYIYEEENND